MNNTGKTIMWIAGFMLVFMILSNIMTGGNKSHDAQLRDHLLHSYATAENTPPVSRITTNDVIEKAKSGSIVYYLTNEGTIHGFAVEVQNPQQNTAALQMAVSSSAEAPDIIHTLANNGVRVHTVSIHPKEPSFFERWGGLLIMIGFFAIIYFIIFRKASGGGGGSGASGFGKSKAKMQKGEDVNVTFDDVAGQDEAKADASEMVDFLKNPAHYVKLGAKMPTGVLMVGQPGTGKTLMAKAIAGEAGVPFFSMSGSDFVEMFVGVGASRVRDTFEQAKKHAPAIIFIDEIDAVGRQRGSGIGGGHDEREQTLNALLVEMDGFEGSEGIIVIAATNRPDVLDPALLRPGRFDRQLMVTLPDIKGREQILLVHMQKVAIGEKVAREIAPFIARSTPGYSGADLANLVNEAALHATRNDQEAVLLHNFEAAKDKIMMGSERSLVMTDEDKRCTARHEAGHAIVGFDTEHCGHDPVQKVTIVPRGRALGVTMFIPENDAVSYSKRKLDAMISTLYGGRIAEEIYYGLDGITTGAENDIERATDIADKMVTQWGLVGGTAKEGDEERRTAPRRYTQNDSENPFLGRDATRHKDVSGDTIHNLDKRIEDVLSSNYRRAHQILEFRRNEMDVMTEALMKYETIDRKMIEEIMGGKALNELTQPVTWSDADEKAWQDAQQGKQPTVATTSDNGSTDDSSEPED